MSLPRCASLLGSCLVAAALVACGGNSEQSTSAATGSGGGGTGGGAHGGAGGGASDDCPAGSHGTLPACTATLDKWAAAPSLTTARDHHVTFAATTPAGDFLYVAGGANAYTILTNIERAPIEKDGSLGVFQSDVPLPEGLAGAGLAQIGNTVVIAGGLIVSGGTAISGKSTYVGTVDDAAKLSFAKGPDLVTDRYHVSLSTDRGFVYAIGGLRQFYTNGNPMQTVSDAVERATFDGKTVGKWASLSALPHPLTHQAAVVRDHAIYLVGGVETTTVVTDILRADLDAQGNVGAWKSAGMLPEGRATSAAFVFLNQLYVLCGSTLAQGGEVDTVLRASFDKEGGLGSFEELAPVPMARAHVHQTPFLNGFIYSAGGSANGAYEQEVFVGKMM